MPYRTSAIATRTRETVPLPTVLGLRFLALSFALAAAACALVMFLVDRNAASAAIRAGIAVPRVVSLAVPVGVMLIGVRATRDARSRNVAFSTAALWLVALVGERFFVGVPERGFSLAALVAVGVAHALGLAGLLVVPFLTAKRRVVVRWPFLAAGAIAVADTVNAARYAYERLFSIWFEPSVSSLVLFGLLAYGFHEAARAVREESLDERADRLPASFTSMFATPEHRSAFIGPVQSRPISSSRSPSSRSPRPRARWRMASRCAE